MRLKRILVACVLILTLSATSVFAMDYEFWVEDIGPEKIQNDDEKTEEEILADIQLVRDIAMKYSDIYVVTEEQSLDISSIDNYLEACCSPLSLAELDSGKASFSYDTIFDSQEHKDFTKRFRNYAGPCGLSVYFEPIAYFKIYRNISLVGGYYDYSDCNLDVELGLNKTVEYIQDMTKEIVQWETKEAMRQQINDLYWDIKQDKGLKAFILVGDGSGNSSTIQSVFRLN